MFGSRRHRQPFTPPTAATVNPNAATAAASAFQLSSAAAATALRTQPPPVTNVAEVQTKRTMRRSASASSQGSRRGLSPAPSLRRGGGRGSRGGSAGSASPHRRNSSASLSERTFRSPSPHNRQSASTVTSTSTTATTADTDYAQYAVSGSAATGVKGAMPPPPVPSIPTQHVNSAALQQQQHQHLRQQQQKQQPAQQTRQQPIQNRRANSLGLVQQPLRLASQQTGSQGSWFGGARVSNMANVRRHDAAMNINNYASRSTSTSASTSVPSTTPAPAAPTLAAAPALAPVSASPASPPAATPAVQSPSATSQDGGRPGSRNSSVNFSYPARLRLASPPGSPAIDLTGEPSSPIVPIPTAQPPARAASVERGTQQPRRKPVPKRSASTSRAVVHQDPATTDQTLVYDANSRRMVPRAELVALEQEVMGVSERKRLRKKRQSPSRAGSYLGRGSMLRTARQEEPELPEQTHHRHQHQATNAHQIAAVTAAAAAAAAMPEAAQSDPPFSPPYVERSQAIGVDGPVQQYIQPAGEIEDYADSYQPGLPNSAYTEDYEPEPVEPEISGRGVYQELEPTPSSPDSRPALVKRPSVVREEPELEEEEGQVHHRYPKQTAIATSLNMIDETNTGSPSKQTQFAEQQPSSALQQQQEQQYISAPEVAIYEPQPQRHEMAAVANERTHSISPARTAHFAPVAGNNLTVRRHSPPPRSISPRKSAMKQTSSPRDASPSDDASDVGQSSRQLEPTPSRRKSVRVSFDDEHTVVVPQEVSSSSSLSLPTPQASEPYVFAEQPQQPQQPQQQVYLQQQPQPQPQQQQQQQQQPTHKRTWFSNIGRSKKKDMASSADDDVVMRPRPALPSFGSVRDKSQQQSREPEERTLVRPQTAVYATAAAAVGAAAVLSPAVSELKEEPIQQQRQSSTPPPSQQQQQPPQQQKQKQLEMMGTSSDQVIGSILTQHDSASSLTRNTANTSRYREPLPPVVLSVDGSGYVSDASSTISMGESEAALLADTPVPGSMAGSMAGSEEHLEEYAPADASRQPVAVYPTSQTVNVTHAGRTGDSLGNGSVERVATASPILTEKATTVSIPPPRPVPVFALTRPSQESVATLSKRAPSPTGSVYDLPGTFPEDSDPDDREAFVESPLSKLTALAGSVPIRQGTFEPVVQSDDSQHTSQTPGTVLATHMPAFPDEAIPPEVTDDDDSDSGVFSDAYEDLSDVEGDGFLSLDAVVDSPVTTKFSESPYGVPAPAAPHASTKDIAPTSAVGATLVGVAAVGTAAAATAATATKPRPSIGSGDTEEEDWDKVKAFWRGLSSEKRAQLESEALEEAAAEGDLEEVPAPTKPRHKKSAEKRTAEKEAIRGLTAPPEDPVGDRVKSPLQPPKKALPQIRRSMREAAAASSSTAPRKEARQTLRSPAPEKQQRSRPVSFPQGPATSAAAAAGGGKHSRHVSEDPGSNPAKQQQPKKTQAQIMAAYLQPTLQRKDSDSSESSFKRSRASTSGGSTGPANGMGAGAGGMGFRRTMRRDSASEGVSNNRSSRFSLRSLSPAGSAFGNGRHANPLPSPHGSLEAPQLRRSMRDGPGESRRAVLSPPPPSMPTSLRKSDTGGGGGGFFSLNKGGSKLRRNKSKSAVQAGDGFSSDEDISYRLAASTSRTTVPRRSLSAGGPSTFRSRFADSSDEDDIPPVPKAHVVPKTLRGGKGMAARSASASLLDTTGLGGSPSSTKSLTKKSPNVALAPRDASLPEEMDEDVEQAFLSSKKNRRQSLRSRRAVSASGIPTVNPAAAAAAAASGSTSAANPRNTLTRSDSIGASSLRQSRSGRGDMSPVYSPGAANAGLADNTEHHRRLSSSGGSFISALRRKKETDGAIRREVVDSAARRDTTLERSTRELAAVRRGTPANQYGVEEDEFEDEEDEDDLYRDQTNNTGGSWPLPSPTGGGGTPAANATVTGVISPSDEMVGGKKKKKFPGLRRMFGLDD